MKKNKINKIIGPLKIIFLILSILLLFIAFYGDFKTYSVDKNRPIKYLPNKNIDSFDIHLYKQIHSLSDLKLKIESIEDFDLKSDQEKVRVMYDTVRHLFTHKEAKHSLFTNYILFFMSFFHHNFGGVHNPDILLKKFSYGFCSQQSYVLLRLAEMFGYNARHVALTGHVVCEIFYDDAFHLYDPNHEVFPLKNNYVLSIDELTQNENLDLFKRLYVTKSSRLVFLNKQKHNYVSSPQGAFFSWKVDVLYRLESIMEIFKYIFPLVVFVWVLKSHFLRFFLKK